MGIVRHTETSSLHHMVTMLPYLRWNVLPHTDENGGTPKEVKERFKGKKLSDGKTIGRQNRLTDNLIDTFQHYYGKVLKGIKVGMIRAVNANWHYYSSIEEEPMHQFCPPKPPGSNSWCKWQNDQVSGKKTFKPKKVDKAVMQEVKPVPNCSFAN